MLNTTILYSATRQWNPGDEFILYGVRRIFDAVVCEHNVVIFNRNPYVVKYGRPRMETLRSSMYENSWVDYGVTPDAVVMMGPEWYGNGCEPLYEMVLRQEVPLYLLGIGTSKFDLDETEMAAISLNAKMIVARDEHAQERLLKYGALLDVCPAIFAADFNSLRQSKSKIGITFHAGLYHTSPNAELFNRLHTAWKAIYAKMDVKFLCHTYVDFCDCNTLFPDADIFYSSLAEDYIKEYDSVDVVVGTRIHGMGLAASLGIPGVFVPMPSDDRASAVKGFNSIFAEPEDVLETINQMDVQKISEGLIELKRAAWGRYVERVKAVWEE
jgi:hypothetical protein